MIRHDGRSCLELRPLSAQFSIYPQAAGSVLISLGATRVLCGVSFSQGVPSFMKGTGTGWLTAEYSMLPASGNQRVTRDSSGCKRNGRSVEISRMIGRCLRSCIDLKALGENTLTIDCDVLNADGSTRVAALIGAQLALMHAQQRLQQEGIVKKIFCTHMVAAVSVGLKNSDILVDLTYMEDSSIDADMNFVMTSQGDLVEIQGSAEQSPIKAAVFESMQQAASASIQQICSWMQSFTM